MIQAALNLRPVAERIVAQETRRGSKASSAFEVFERLRAPLAVLMGQGGFRSLLSRALALTSGDSIWLRAVHVRADGSLEGLKELEAQISPSHFIEGSVVLLEGLLGLLVSFIGEELTLHLMTDIWPKVSLEDSNFAQEGKNEKGK